MSTEFEQLNQEGGKKGQYKWWIFTTPWSCWLPHLPKGVQFTVGQLERGESGYLHWQYLFHYEKRQRFTAIKKTVPAESHFEPVKNIELARAYVEKTESRVEGTTFRIGTEPVSRSSKDWDKIKAWALEGKLDQIPSDVYVRCYGSLTRIAKDNLKPQAMKRKVFVLWGTTGTGKSHRAWHAGGYDAYPKGPTSIYWDGYTGQKNVIIEEFRGKIGIEHILRWFDKYPVCIENKFGGTVLNAERIWITSNLHPVDWYPDLDQPTKEALCRRLKIFEIFNQQQQIEFI